MKVAFVLFRTSNPSRRLLGITFLAGLAVPLTAGTATATPVISDPPSPVSYFVEKQDSTNRSFFDFKLPTPKVAPRVTVAKDAIWDAPEESLTVTPAPEPEPVPEPVAPVVVEETVAERTPSTSRTQERQPLAPVEEAPVSVAESAPVAAPAPAVASGSVIDVAASLVGVPYVSGGSSTSGFDCSGYTQFVFAQVGVSLPRTSGAQGSAGVAVSREEGQPGDLVHMPGHVGIYAGNGMMYDAPRPGKNVQLREIWSDDYQLRRVL